MEKQYCVPGNRPRKSRRRKTPDELWETLTTARKVEANLLLNTGPKGDGSIVKEEEETLRELGRRIRVNGWPNAD